MIVFLLSRIALYKYVMLCCYVMKSYVTYCHSHVCMLILFMLIHVMKVLTLYVSPISLWTQRFMLSTFLKIYSK